MKIAVLGATGPLGRQILERALSQGHSVTALVRRPEALVDLEEKFNGDEKLLESHKADIFSVDSLVEHFVGCDAVLGALGPHLSLSRAPQTLMTNSTRTMVEAMRKAGIKRLVICTSIGVDLDPNPTWRARLAYFGFSTTFKTFVQDFRNAEKFLETSDAASDINFTVVKPPRLLNSAFQDKAPLTFEGQRHTERIESKIPRANVAQFMLDSISSDEWSRKLVCISF